MELKRIYIALFVLFSVQTLANAQFFNKKEIQNLKDSLALCCNSLDSIQAVSNQKDTIICQFNAQIKAYKDSVLTLGNNMLLKQIKSKDGEIQKLKDESLSKDKDVAAAQDFIRKYANVWLYSPYDEKGLSKAIDALKQYKNKADASYVKIDRLVKYYKVANDEILSLFTNVDKEIQGLAEFIGRDDCLAQQNKWKIQLEQTTYYREYYLRRNDKNFYSIVYLNRMIDCFLAEINNHTPESRARLTTIITLMKE